MKHNNLLFKTHCEVFDMFNETHNNTLVHFSFEIENDYGPMPEVIDKNF